MRCSARPACCGRPGPSPSAVSADPAPATARHHEPSAETVRGGIHDQNVPPVARGRRRAPLRPLSLGRRRLSLADQKQSDEERFLSCSLNLSWPDQGQVATASAGKEATRIVLALNEVFDHIIVSTRVITSRTHSSDDRFAGWLSYSSFDRSWKALKCLHDAVRSRGLGLRQWSRDLFIPKNWGDRPVE